MQRAWLAAGLRRRRRPRGDLRRRLVRELASGRSFVDVGGMWKLYGEMALTPSAIRAMLDVTRFRLLEECEVQPFALDVLAEPVPGESVIPPVDFARRRGEAREAERYTGSRGEP